MPVLNNTGSFNTGRDINVTIIGPSGTSLQIANLTSFDSKQKFANINVDLLSGTQLNAALPKGWMGSFEAERGSNVLDQMFAFIETAWYNNGTWVGGSIIVSITECQTNTTTTYMFTNVAFSGFDAGSWKGDASVKQKVDFEADRRLSV